MGLQYLSEKGLLIENPKDVNKELVFSLKIFQEGLSFDELPQEKPDKKEIIAINTIQAVKYDIVENEAKNKLFINKPFFKILGYFIPFIIALLAILGYLKCNQ